MKNPENKIADLLAKMNPNKQNSSMIISYRLRNKLWNALNNIIIILAILTVMLPLLWMFYASIRSGASVSAHPLKIFTTDLTLAHYERAFRSNYTLWLYNSIILTVGVVGLNTVLATLGGYGLARLDLPGKKTFARGVLFGYMFPSILLSIPMFIFWSELGIINSRVGLILAVTALSLPFSLWLMWKFFQTVPFSSEEAAMMCGASRFRALVDIALPQAVPGILAVAVFSFAVAWNEYTMARILLPEGQQTVITVGLEQLMADDRSPWGVLMASSSLTVAPAFLFVYFLQKYLIQGFNIE